MSSVLPLFARLIVRPLLSELIRTALTVLAVALGVGVVIAIDLSAQAAAGSFHSSLESLTGKGDLLITGIGGVDEKLLGKLVQLPYPMDFTPRIEDFAFLNGGGEALPFLGLDLVHELERAGGEYNTIAGLTGNPNKNAADRDPIWVGDALGLHVGDLISLLINDKLHEFSVAGVIGPENGQVGEHNLIVADIGVAQLVTGKIGKLDSVGVRLPSGSSGQNWQSLLRHQLPASISVEPQGSRTDENRKMLAAFRSNLRVLSYIALIVGAFLIYNTISVSVVRRRASIGIVRALGATRPMIVMAFLSEALCLAVPGSILGVLLGRYMAFGAVRLIGNTVQSLYVSSTPSPITLTFSAIAAGCSLGISLSLLAALAPAIEASRVPPVEAMARGREQYLVARRSRFMIFWAAVMILAAAAFSLLPAIYNQPIFAYLAVALLIAGAAAAIPAIIDSSAGILGIFVENLLGVEARLAVRGLRASLGRTSVLTSALAIAIAMTASVGIMVGSFRETVELWLNTQLRADFYLRPAGAAAVDRHPTLSPDIADRIQLLPGVASVDRFRAYPIDYQGLPAALAGGEITRQQNSAATRFLPGEDRKRILSLLPTGDYAVVSEPFANKHHVSVGGSVTVPLAGASRTFQVLGIYYDYSSERGFIIFDRKTLLKYLPDPSASNLAIYLKPDANTQEVRRGIAQITARRAVLVFSNASLRSGAIEIFDRTFRITYALEAVAIVVAVIGVAGALLAMVIDRRRDFALLRFLGATQPQVRRIVLCEAGILSLFASAVGLVLGTLMSLILIFVINKQSFGWTIQFHWPTIPLLIAIFGIDVATVLAGLYPARIAIRLNPIEAVHES